MNKPFLKEKMDYHADFSCTKEEAWQCYTVKQQLKVTADVHFSHMRDDNYVLQQDNEVVDSQHEDDDDGSIWSSESVPFDICDAEDVDFEVEAEGLFSSDDDASTLLLLMSLSMKKPIIHLKTSSPSIDLLKKSPPTVMTSKVSSPNNQDITNSQPTVETITIE